MEKNGEKILAFRRSPKREDGEKEILEKEGKKSLEGGDVIESDIERERRIRDLEKELSDLKKEKENFRAKVILGEKKPQEKARLRREFMGKMDDFGKRADKEYLLLRLILSSRGEKNQGRAGVLMKKVLEMGKIIGEIREEIWSIFK